MPKKATVPLSELTKEPYASVVCYPRASPEEMEPRLRELQELKVDTVEFSGKSSAHTMEVLGKGYVGIVVTAHVGGEQFALKMQRVDSDRASLMREAELLAMANSVGVGPKFLGVTKHFLLMQLIDGCALEDWLESHSDKTEVRNVVAEVLEQCWRLDEISLDHGELSKAHKHILLDSSGKPYIVDFETASTTRNASNVTSVCQYLFQGKSEACKAIAKVLGERDRGKVIAVLRSYRKTRSRTNFEALVKLCLS